MRVIWGWELFWTKETKDSLGEFMTEFYSIDHNITVISTAKFSRGGVYKPKLQAKIVKLLRDTGVSLQITLSEI